MEELIEKMFVGFDGSMFYEAVYQDKNYYADIDEGIIYLLSTKPLTEKSEPESDGFYTEVSIKELDGIYQIKLYITYMGNEYETQIIGPHMLNIELLGRNDHKDEDLALGFVEEPYYDKTFNKFISRDEVESFRIERKSVNKELLAEYAK